MTYKVLTLKDQVEWNRLLLDMPEICQDIYFTPEYYSLYESKGDGQALCFVFKNDKNLILYPFLLNSINILGYKLDKEYFDIQGAYGYNGYISNCNDDDFLLRFKSIFESYCKETNIIAEFIRFNPIIEINNNNFGNKTIHVNNVINIRLDVSKEILFNKSYKNDIRRIIKKGIELGYTDKTILIGEATDKEIDDFIFVYYSTLKRNVADDFYYFSKEYFLHIKKIMPNNLLMSIVYLDNKPIGASSNFFKGQNAYGFFGGSLHEYQKVSPFTFVTHCVNLKLMSLGIKNYLIGGGSQIGDSIFKYKRNFARDGIIEFYIGKNVYNEIVYKEISQQWKDKYPESFNLHSNKLLGYRNI